MAPDLLRWRKREPTLHTERAGPETLSQMVQERVGQANHTKAAQRLYGSQIAS